MRKSKMVWLQKNDLIANHKNDFLKIAPMFLCLLSLCLSAKIGYVISRSLFLSVLPSSYVAIFFLVMPISIAIFMYFYYRFSPKMGGQKGDTIIMIGSALLLVFIWFFLTMHWAYSVSFLISLCIAIDLISNVTYIHFWIFAIQISSALEAKRLFIIISSAYIFGDILSGLIMNIFSAFTDVENFIWLMVLLMISAKTILFYSRKKAIPPDNEIIAKNDSKKTDYIKFSTKKLLHSILLIILMTTIVSSLTNYQFDLALQARFFGDKQKMAFFMGYLQIISSAVGFLFMLIFLLNNGKDVRTVWLLLIFPIIAISGAFSVFITFGAFWAICLPFVANFSLKFVINRPALNCLYSPLNKNEKAKTKSLYEGVAKPVAEIMIGLIIMLLSYTGLNNMFYLSALILFFASLLAIFTMFANYHYEHIINKNEDL